MDGKYWVFDPENTKKYWAGDDITTIHFTVFADDQAILEWLVRETRVPIPTEGVGTLSWVHEVRGLFVEHLPGWLMLIQHATPT